MTKPPHAIALTLLLVSWPARIVYFLCGQNVQLLSQPKEGITYHFLAFALGGVGSAPDSTIHTEDPIACCHRSES